ncbi:MAG: ISAs1 family transposase [Rhodopila sp.]
MSKKHFAAARQAGITLIVQVKANQPTLEQTIAGIVAKTAPITGHHDDERGRSRFESRTVAVFDPGETFAGSEWKPHVGAIVRVERLVYTRATRTGLLSRASETAFYVSSQPIIAERAAKAIRAHWRIETTSHYSRDVTFGEDGSRIRCNPGVFARLRSFAFNLLKVRPSSTLRQDRYRAALKGFDALAELVSA